MQTSLKIESKMRIIITSFWKYDSKKLSGDLALSYLDYILKIWLFYDKKIRTQYLVNKIVNI